MNRLVLAIEVIEVLVSWVEILNFKKEFQSNFFRRFKEINLGSMRQRAVNTPTVKSDNNSDLSSFGFNDDGKKSAAKAEANRFRKIILLIVAVTIHNIPG